MEPLLCLSSSSPPSALRVRSPASHFIGLPIPSPSTSRPNLSVRCRGRFGGGGGGDAPLDGSSARDVLGVEPSCSPTELKAAFRAKVWTKRMSPIDCFDSVFELSWFVSKRLMCGVIFWWKGEAVPSWREQRGWFWWHDSARDSGLWGVIIDASTSLRSFKYLLLQGGCIGGV